MLDNIQVIAIYIIINLNSLLIGYLLGSSIRVKINDKPQSFFTKNKDSATPNNDLSIDNKKIVLNIKTDGLEKKYESLGEVKQTEENITNSVSKLKNLKR